MLLSLKYSRLNLYRKSFFLKENQKHSKIITRCHRWQLYFYGYCEGKMSWQNAYFYLAISRIQRRAWLYSKKTRAFGGVPYGFQYLWKCFCIQYFILPNHWNWKTMIYSEIDRICVNMCFTEGRKFEGTEIAMEHSVFLMEIGKPLTVSPSRIL